MRGPLRATCAIVAAGLVPGFIGSTAQAGTTEYRLDIRDRERVAFEIPIDAQYPGTVEIDARWSGARILTFRIEGPGALRVWQRRGGPSPQKLDVSVRPESSEEPVPLKLKVSGLPASGAGNGVLRVTVPDHPAVVAARQEALKPAPPPAPEPEPWMIASISPAGTRADRDALFSAIESFRTLVVQEDDWSMVPDACRWHTGGLRYLVEQRRRIMERGELPDIATRRWFRSVAKTFAEIERLRTSDDPLLAGPAPDRTRLYAWKELRSKRLKPLERQLDRLRLDLKEGFVPELSGEDWPMRFVSCMTACQRHFDERAIRGPGAANAVLAQREWEPIRAMSRSLEALSALSAEPIAGL